MGVDALHNSFLLFGAATILHHPTQTNKTDIQMGLKNKILLSASSQLQDSVRPTYTSFNKFQTVPNQLSVLRSPGLPELPKSEGRSQANNRVYYSSFPPL